MSLHFVALGDSTTVGVGDPLLGSALPRTGAGAMPGQGWRGWAALLAEALGSSQPVSYRNFATSGATAPAVLRDQLPASGAGRIDLASLVVGVNDTMRSSFDGDRIRDCLLACADQLSRRGALLLTVRFHDHGQVFGLPGCLRRPLWRRIDQVNAVYDEVRDRYGGIQVDLHSCPEVYRREFWSIDRLHPGERGHRRLARTFADELVLAGIPIATPPALSCPDAATPTRWDDTRWMIREGAPWLARRAKDLTPWALRLALTHHSPQVARRVGDRSPQPALPVPGVVGPRPGNRGFLGEMRPHER